MNSNFLRSLKHHTPTLLSIVASLGVIATTALSVRATPKALQILEKERVERKTEPQKLDILKLTWHCYIPAALVGMSTIGCIFGANTLNRRQQAALASTYAFVSESYRNYKSKLKTLYGERAHEEIMSAIAKEKYDPEHAVSCMSMFPMATLDWGDYDEGIKTFYDVFSQRYFESTIVKVLQAEYYFNRDFHIGGLCIELNRFYDFLGIPPIECGNIIGYNCAEEFLWIDFNHWKTTLDDGLEVYYIEPIIDSDIIKE